MERLSGGGGSRFIARIRGEDFNLLLFRYGIERLLYRLSVSAHADRFILKGSSLFLVWKGQTYRVTKDVDLISNRQPKLLEQILALYCRTAMALKGRERINPLRLAIRHRLSYEVHVICAWMEGRK
ncbi:MAG: nucleotidyl transferase AbiEii/AbiGii toxin family protein [Pseudomonadota bacterium]